MRNLCALAASWGLIVAAAVAAAEKAPAVADDADRPLTGEAMATLGGKNWGLQIVALGNGKFMLTRWEGGLPGMGYSRDQERATMEANRDGDAVTFTKGDFSATVTAKTVKASLGGESVGPVAKLERVSPTLGNPPPAGAVVLFDGTSADKWENGKLSPEGYLMEGVKSKDTFGSHQLHLEFLLAYMPTARGQGRANSGLYVQGRYEVQILDSFGLDGADNECGGIYKASKPIVNMCFPPLAWQTYDVDFTAAQFADGKKTANARITVRHNGVVIHDNLELPGITPGGVSNDEAKPGPIYLQNHGNPIRFRNIWVKPKE